MKLKKSKLKIIALTVGIAFFLFLGLNLLIFQVDSCKQTNPDNNLDASVGVSNQSIPGYGVVADNDQAVDIGMKILEQGGSAVDAAIAVSYALGVVSPFASGIGGGGIMLVYPSDGTAPVAYDYMGSAPKNTTGTIAVPGFIKGMAAAHNDFGQLPMETLLDPAIKLAKDGAVVTPLLSSMVVNSEAKIDVDSRNIFLPDGSAVQAGDQLKQPALAETMEKLKLQGSEDFYHGSIAVQIANSNSGLTLSDLASYKAIKQTPAEGHFSGYEVYSSPPSSGGITLIQMLSLSEKLDLNKYPVDSAEYITLLSEITQVSYDDRYQNIYDPEFYTVDVDKLTSDSYISQLSGEITSSANPGQSILVDSPAESKGEENTTHFVICDQNGMMVSVTNTLTYWFGDGKNIAGFFMNSHMENFSASALSLNKAEAGKRPRSYISPTILAKNGKPIIGIGSPGGKRIPLMITEVLERFLKYNSSLQNSVDAPRFYNNQNLIYLEDNYLTTSTENKLREKGYSIIRYDDPLFYGGVNVLYVDYPNKEILGGADEHRNASWQWKSN